MGTGITTGPFTLTAGQTLSFNDPATWSVNSSNVQIQNNTGFNIYVQSAGGGYNIQPFTASTIPCAGGQTLVGVVSSTANVQTGFLSAVWLLPGQTPPMPDGPMTVFPTTSQIVTSTKNSSSKYTIGPIGPNANNLTVNFNATWTSGPASATITGSTSGTVYYSANSAGGVPVLNSGNNSTTFLVSSTIDLNYVLTGTSSGGSFTINSCYAVSSY